MKEYTSRLEKLEKKSLQLEAARKIIGEKQAKRSKEKFGKFEAGELNISDMMLDDTLTKEEVNTINEADRVKREYDELKLKESCYKLISREIQHSALQATLFEHFNIENNSSAKLFNEITFYEYLINWTVNGTYFNILIKTKPEIQYIHGESTIEYIEIVNFEIL